MPEALKKLGCIFPHWGGVYIYPRVEFSNFLFSTILTGFQRVSDWQAFVSAGQVNTGTGIYLRYDL